MAEGMMKTATQEPEPEPKPKRLATLVGCNYAGTPHELRGCINDVHAMRDLLVARFGFAPAEITVLTDDAAPGAGNNKVLPTGANIKRALSDMVARAGDVLFFHYSGHGTLVPPVMPDHRGRHRDDEAIVPCDFNLITDVDFRRVVDRVPRGASFTIVSDSCHSGGLIDNEKEQIGPATVDDDDDLVAAAGSARPSRTTRARFIPYAALVGHLAGASGLHASRHAADHLLALFGADASAKWWSHHNKHRHGHGHHGMDDDPSLSPDNDEGILLSGCQTDETSADVVPEEEEDDDEGRRKEKKKACGAFSSAVQAVLAAHPAAMSNREVVRGARAVLSEQGFDQHPCLYCSDGNADKPFLCQQQGAAKEQEDLCQKKKKERSRRTRIDEGRACPMICDSACFSACVFLINYV
ncbi:hypothetical protein PR202_gb16502 [Eleusine coracana subsp. coracana]|uniref:Peptidase C14 caspase domain-containing protein n=1 Tax=Eleusine coracana subsp. coracana TaxID=191504 RepID=A0AAV5EYB5_ELECO|nr:hypothetical protein QOZ80_9BG0697300 [Eleusine coracana subsp. coracana]GJN28389.1 hypothetical protein PR202_gb16502 [Eleusine coracana subsp. coracana]